MQPCSAAAEAPLVYMGTAMPSLSQQPGLPSHPWELLGICCPWSWLTAGLGGTAPKRQCLPPERWWFRGVFGTQLGLFSQSLILLHCYTPLLVGILCPVRMNSSANIFALLCATPFPSPSSGAMGWLQPGSGQGPVPCPVEAGRQFASPRPLLMLEDAAITTAACLAALLPHPAHCALQE